MYALTSENQMAVMMNHKVIIKTNMYTCRGVVMRCMAIIMFHFSLLSTFSQIPELNFRYYSKSEGLSSSNTFDIAQDSIGFIWIGTNNGLDKFDGYSFTHYKSDFEDPYTLPDNRIQELFIDSHGTLWIGTNRGICTYNHQKDWFNRIATPKLSSGIDDSDFKSITENQNGDIFVLTNNIVYKYDSARFELENIYEIDQDLGNLIFVDDDNFIWIGTNESGIIKLNCSFKPIKKYKFGNENNSLSCNSIYDIVKWENNIWVATLGGGINVIDLENDIVSVIPTNELNETYSFHLSIDNFNQLWAIDYKGLKFFDKTKNSFTGNYPDEKNPYSIKGNAKAIYQDKQNNYWILHEPGGIAVSTVPRGFTYYTTGKNNHWHTSDSKILSVCEDKNNNTWLGLASNGVDIFYWENGKTDRFSYNPDDPNSIGQGAIQCIFKDSDNTMWVSSYFTGLQRYDETTKNFYTYKLDKQDPNTISTPDIRAIKETKSGDLLLAAHGKGVDRFNRKTGKFYHYTESSHKLSNCWVFDVLEDSKGNIWAATSWGLNVLRKGETTFRYYHQVSKDSTSLSDSHVLCLFEDSRRLIWVGTINGLNVYNEKEDNFIHFNQGIESQYICGILEDTNNNIWISTQEGISKIDFATQTVENFDNNEGIRSGEFYPRATFLSSERGLMFGGTKGVDIIDVNKLNRNITPPNVIITKFKLFNEEITNITHPELLENNISTTKSINLRFNQNTLNISYVALNYINPKKNKYAYKLEGFDSKWNEVGVTRQAIYTNLDPGEYVFKVIASNNDNVWSTAGASLKINIMPPWYKTTIFRIFILIVIVLLLIMINNYRTKQFKKQQEILEHKVDEKTEELLEKNKLLEEKSENLKEAYALLIERQHQLQIQSRKMKKQSNNLETANKELQSLNNTKDKLFSIIAHDLTSPFNTILGFSDLLVQNYKKMNDKDRIRLITIINSSSVKVFSLLQNLLLWARTQTKRLNHLPENIDLQNAINDVLELLKAGYTQKNITIDFNCSASMMVYADIEMTKTIIRNLLNNAIKFTPQNGTIQISITNQTKKKNKDDVVYISIKDSGVGMSEEIITSILDSAPIKPGEGTEGEIGTGLGLTICKEFLKINGGKLNIESSIGKGSNFIFTLPLAK